MFCIIHERIRTISVIKLFRLNELFIERSSISVHNEVLITVCCLEIFFEILFCSEWILF